MYWSLFFNKVIFLLKLLLTSLKLLTILTNFIKKRLQHKCFPVHIEKFLRTPILKNICQQLFSPLIQNFLLQIQMVCQYKKNPEYTKVAEYKNVSEYKNFNFSPEVQH